MLPGGCKSRKISTAICVQNTGLSQISLETHYYVRAVYCLSKKCLLLIASSLSFNLVESQRNTYTVHQLSHTTTEGIFEVFTHVSLLIFW